MKEILTEEEKKQIRDLYFSNTLTEDKFGEFLSDEFRQIFDDFASGRITEKEMEMRVKLALLEEEVKFLKDIFVDYPEIAERVQDSNLVQLIDWVKQRVNSAPDLFFPSVESKEELSKHEYSNIIIAGVISELFNLFPDLKGSEDVSDDLVNYLKFYHDDELFSGLDELNF